MNIMSGKSVDFSRTLSFLRVGMLVVAGDQPQVCSGPMLYVFSSSIWISSGLKRFLPDKMSILVVLSGQRPVFPDVFLVQR